MLRGTRTATTLRWLSLLVIAASLFVLFRVLPIETGVDRLRRWVQGLGYLGPLAFGGCYVAGTVLFVPGAMLTVAAGAVFGFAAGVAIVSVASTIAAACAFLIARHVARARVAVAAARHPRFGAIDSAIGAGGWRIVALLRLVPAFPFSFGNYLFGLTPVRFGPYVITSWLFMLPGALLYVYIGHVGAQGVTAVSSEAGSVDTGRWVLLIVGLLAAVIASVYLTRLARRAIRVRTSIEALLQPRPAGGAADSTLVVTALAILSLGAVAWAQSNRDQLRGLFGPPVVRSAEAWSGVRSDRTVDHGAFDRLLAGHVDAQGLVDYITLGAEAAELDAYLASLRETPIDELARDERLALWINAYNACTLRLILDHYPIDSITSIPSDRRWQDVRWRIGSRSFSLDAIEHDRIRPNFVEPRIHFALVCAAIGCPRLRNEAYVAHRLDEQLADQAQFVHASERWVRLDRDAGVLELTRLYDWYGSDFEFVHGSVLRAVARYVVAVREMLDDGREPRVRWLEYDWSLNDRARTPR